MWITTRPRAMRPSSACGAFRHTPGINVLPSTPHTPHTSFSDERQPANPAVSRKEIMNVTPTERTNNRRTISLSVRACSA